MSYSILDLRIMPPPNSPPDTREIAARLAILLAGRYLVLRLIGIGGMASVYLVRHRILHSHFAVKVLHPAYAEQPELLARFRLEGLLGARLAGHPHIAPVLDVGEGDGLHYLMMPYIRGEDLDHLLARVGPFCLDDAVFTLMQVNEALLYAWENGILHCDLTPGNIRLNEFGHFVLFDFGLASVSASPRQPALPPDSTTHPGTPRYLSPERILGGQIDIRSDLYALGAILYELLTGEAAFRGDSVEEIGSSHLARDRSFLHPNLQEHASIPLLLKSLLAHSPADRFADPLELRQALRELATGQPELSLRPKIESGEEIASPRRRLAFR
jgi:serine/threonine-protein kinase